MQFEADRDQLNLGSFETISLLKSFHKCDLQIQVLLIKHKQSQQVFALKKILKPQNQQDLNALLREFSLLKQLDHPNIIKLYSYKQTDNEVYALFEYMDKNLKKEYKNISEQEAAMVILQVAQALEYLHSKYILHRDVNLSNVLLTGSGYNIKAKLIDFQYAGTLKESRVTQYGSLDSLAPQIISEQNQNEKVDVWGLGVMIYLLFTKSQPFFVKGEMSYQLTTDNIKKCNIKYPETLSPVIKSLLQKILVTNPLLRLTLTEILGNPYFKQSKQKLQQIRQREYLQKKVLQLQRELNNQKNKEVKSKESQQLEKKLQKLQQQYKIAQQVHDKQKLKLKETEIQCMKLQKQRRSMQEYRMNLQKSKLQLNKINHNILLVVQQNKKIKHKTIQLQAELEFLKKQQQKQKVDKVQRIDSKLSASSLSKYMSTGSKQKSRSKVKAKEPIQPILQQSKSTRHIN